MKRYALGLGILVVLLLVLIGLSPAAPASAQTNGPDVQPMLTSGCDVSMFPQITRPRHVILEVKSTDACNGAPMSWEISGKAQDSGSGTFNRNASGEYTEIVNFEESSLQEGDAVYFSFNIAGKSYNAAATYIGDVYYPVFVGFELFENDEGLACLGRPYGQTDPYVYVNDNSPLTEELFELHHEDPWTWNKLIPFPTDQEEVTFYVTAYKKADKQELRANNFFTFPNPCFEGGPKEARATVLKVDPNGLPVEGATFWAKNLTNGATLITPNPITSDEYGVVMVRVNLPAGVNEAEGDLVEIAPPPGFEMPEDPVTRLYFRANTQSDTVVVVNKRILGDVTGTKGCQGGSIINNSDFALDNAKYYVDDLLLFDGPVPAHTTVPVSYDYTDTAEHVARLVWSGNGHVNVEVPLGTFSDCREEAPPVGQCAVEVLDPSYPNDSDDGHKLVRVYAVNPKTGQEVDFVAWKAYGTGDWDEGDYSASGDAEHNLTVVPFPNTNESKEYGAQFLTSQNGTTFTGGPQCTIGHKTSEWRSGQTQLSLDDITRSQVGLGNIVWTNHHVDPKMFSAGEMQRTSIYNGYVSSVPTWAAAHPYDPLKVSVRTYEITILDLGNGKIQIGALYRHDNGEISVMSLAPYGRFDNLFATIWIHQVDDSLMISISYNSEDGIHKGIVMDHVSHETDEVTFNQDWVSEVSAHEKGKAAINWLLWQLGIVTGDATRYYGDGSVETWLLGTKDTDGIGYGGPSVFAYFNTLGRSVPGFGNARPDQVLKAGMIIDLNLVAWNSRAKMFPTFWLRMENGQIVSRFKTTEQLKLVQEVLDRYTAPPQFIAVQDIAHSNIKAGLYDADLNYRIFDLAPRIRSLGLSAETSNTLEIWNAALMKLSSERGLGVLPMQNFEEIDNNTVLSIPTVLVPQEVTVKAGDTWESIANSYMNDSVANWLAETGQSVDDAKWLKKLNSHEETVEQEINGKKQPVVIRRTNAHLIDAVGNLVTGTKDAPVKIIVPMPLRPDKMPSGLGGKL
jgi:hypothetical protein